jgi:hypothetical protein
VVRAVGKKRFSFSVWGVAVGVGLRQIRCTARGGWFHFHSPVRISISSS